MTFYFTLTNALTKSKVYLPSLGVNPRIKFWGGQNPLSRYWSSKLSGTDHVATSTVPNLTNCYFHVYGPKFDPSISNSLLSSYRSRTTIAPYCSWEKQSIALAPVNGAKTTDLILTALSGTYHGIFFFARPIGTVQEQRYSDSRYPIDSTGTPVTTPLTNPTLNTAYRDWETHDTTHLIVTGKQIGRAHV